MLFRCHASTVSALARVRRNMTAKNALASYSIPWKHRIERPFSFLFYRSFSGFSSSCSIIRWIFRAFHYSLLIWACHLEQSKTPSIHSTAPSPTLLQKMEEWILTAVICRPLVQTQQWPVRFLFLSFFSIQDRSSSHSIRLTKKWQSRCQSAPWALIWANLWTICTTRLPVNLVPATSSWLWWTNSSTLLHL